ncbi:hypothetical protein [Cupriavidus consociatus]|uniref:hypothetical protein n=1 Tax=Cupriavidus consociatus TaxID=2821357 RepID=UPI001AE0F7BC|nr:MULTISPECIES: hypothetical protein [unclassified Cupriavidus]MBP0624018.1 hypothetical protein [Cupriavidus sp. LEh25]MDK2660728.1 hypothetical protein [Cupriavidus sp. LEh21]
MPAENVSTYDGLKGLAEEEIRALEVRAKGLPKPQQERLASMALGALGLWRRIVDQLAGSELSVDVATVDADQKSRHKNLIRRPDRSSYHAGSSEQNLKAAKSYGVHWHRVQRYVSRVLDPSFGTGLQRLDAQYFYEDDVLATLIQLHHLKDWLPETMRPKIEEFIDSHESLQLCADLANIAKHAWLNPKKGGSVRSRW